MVPFVFRFFKFFEDECSFCFWNFSVIFFPVAVLDKYFFVSLFCSLFHLEFPDWERYIFYSVKVTFKAISVEGLDYLAVPSYV